MDDKDVIEIDEVAEEPQKIEKEFDTEGLLPQEIEKAREHGLIKDDPIGEYKDAPLSEPEKKEEDSEEINTDPDNFEDMDKILEEKGKQVFNETFTSNQKGLYWKAKAERRKRQEAQKQAEEYRAKAELQQVQDNVANAKLGKIRDLLQKEDLTVQELEAVLNDQPQPVEEKTDADKKLQEIEAEKKTQEFQQTRMVEIEEVGVSLHEDFSETVKIANEFVQSNKNSLYAKTLSEAFQSPDVDAVDVVDMIYQVAKLSGKSPVREVDPKVQRAVKNANKPISSAALTPNKSGKRTVSYDDITPEIAARMTTQQWSKLPDNVRKRILQQQ